MWGHAAARQPLCNSPTASGDPGQPQRWVASAPPAAPEPPAMWLSALCALITADRDPNWMFSGQQDWLSPARVTPRGQSCPAHQCASQGSPSYISAGVSRGWGHRLCAQSIPPAGKGSGWLQLHRQQVQDKPQECPCPSDKCSCPGRLCHAAAAVRSPADACTIAAGWGSKRVVPLPYLGAHHWHPTGAGTGGDTAGERSLRGTCYIVACRDAASTRCTGHSAVPPTRGHPQTRQQKLLHHPGGSFSLCFTLHL